MHHWNRHSELGSQIGLGEYELMDDKSFKNGEYLETCNTVF